MAWGMKNITIQLIGSSIMEGRIGVERAADRWYELMRSALCERFPDTCFSVINSAVGGESTRELMTHLESDLAGHHTDLFLVMVGANNNDLTRPERVLVPGEMLDLMERFYDRVSRDSKIIGVILNPVVGEWHWCFHRPEYQEALKKAGSFDAFMEPEREDARSFFRRHGLPFLDLHELLTPAERYICADDGIHLNPAGHRRFAEEMLKLLIPMIP